MALREGYNFSPDSNSFYVKVKGPMPPKDYEVWWRADDRRYANYDPWAEYEQPAGSHLMVELTPYIVEKHTPKGVWIRGYFGNKRFVLGTAVKQFAVPTQELALQDLVKRKEKHVWRCEYDLRVAKEHLGAAKHLLNQFQKKETN